MDDMHEKPAFIKPLTNREITRAIFDVNLSVHEMSEILDGKGFQLTNDSESQPFFQKDVFSGSSDDPFPFNLEVQTVANHNDGILRLRILIENPAGRLSCQDDAQVRENILQSEFKDCFNLEGDLVHGNRIYGDDLIQNHFSRSAKLPLLATYLDYPDHRTEAEKDMATRTFELESLATQFGFDLKFKRIVERSGELKDFVDVFFAEIIAKNVADLKPEEIEVIKVLSSEDAPQFKDIVLKMLRR